MKFSLRRVLLGAVISYWLLFGGATSTHAQALPMRVPSLCAPFADKRVVASGESYTPTSGTEERCVELLSGGELVIPSGLQWKVGTLLARPGSRVRAATPVLTGVRIELGGHPIDTTVDAEQWGEGLIGFGEFKIAGAPKTNFVRAAAEPKAGQRTIVLAESPAGWLPADRLVVPETRQDRGQESWSEVCVIASITGPTVTCVAPLQFDHLGARRPDTTLVFLPHIANLTRSVEITSRALVPNGVLGHVAFIDRADVDIRYVAFRNLGRTCSRFDPSLDAAAVEALDLKDTAIDMLDSTTIDMDGKVTHIGTCQKGRYALHLHHVAGPLAPQPNGKQFTLIGLAIEDFDKWGAAFHNTHWGLAQDFVVFNGHGAGIVMEDGSETANQLVHHFVAKVHNFGQFDGSDFEDAHMRLGGCYVFRAANQELRDSVCVDTREGIDYMLGGTEHFPLFAQLEVRVPKAPGVDTHVDANVTVTPVMNRPRLANDNNEVYAVTRYGLGCWVCGVVNELDAPISNLRLWHIGTGDTVNEKHAGILGKYDDFKISGLTMVNEGGRGLAIAQFNPAFSLKGTPPVVPSLIENADIRGFDVCWARVGQLGQARWWEWRNVTCQTTVGLPLNNYGQTTLNHPEFNLKNVKFLALPGKPLRAIETTFVAADLLPRVFTIRLESYQGDPNKNYQVYFLEPTGGEGPAPVTTTLPGIVGYVGPLGTTPTPTPTPTPVDCVVSAWSVWSAWTSNGDGTESRTRTRTVVTPASNGGAVCPPLSETETRPITAQLSAPTITNKACEVQLTISKPTGSGWKVQYFDNGIAITSSSTTVLRASTFKVGTHQVTAVWTKSGVDPIASQMKPFTVDAAGCR